jgi:hypothetical protein
VKGARFMREDSPNEVDGAIARFVAKVLAGQIGREQSPLRKSCLRTKRDYYEPDNEP